MQNTGHVTEMKKKIVYMWIRIESLSKFTAFHRWEYKNMHVKLADNASRPDTDWSWQTRKCISSTAFKIHPYSTMLQSDKTWPLNNMRMSYRIQFTLTFTNCASKIEEVERKKKP